MGPFEKLLTELSGFIGSELKPDHNNCCLLAFEDGFEVYIEGKEGEKAIIIGAMLGTMAPGRGRETLCKAALEANREMPPRFGTLAYSRRADQLVRYEKLPLFELTGKELAGYLIVFAEKAREWRDAIRSGVVPS